jgi:predicted metal-dependent HD superfamily phosphohydrolase
VIYEQQERTTRELVARSLVDKALMELEKLYRVDSTDPKAYHNREHAMEVIDAAEQIANELIAHDLLSPDEGDLVVIAAAYHDISHQKGRQTNEEESAALAEEAMRATGLFSEEEIARVKSAILATKVSFPEGKFQQNISEDSDILSKILADADLASLGRDYDSFWKSSLNLWRENEGRSTVTYEEITYYMPGEIKFLKDHRFHTQEAETLFPNKPANIAELERLLIGRAMSLKS